MFDSVDALSAKLAAAGYFIDQLMAKVVFLAVELRKPILLEGPAGSGKTQLAVSLAQAAKTQVERLQCYPGITDKQVIGEFDHGLQRLYMEFCKDKGMSWDEIVANLTGRDFYRPRAVMRAFETPSPCVLLVDELDKVPEEIDAQALKRACSRFGLGRYLYDLGPCWLPLDRDGRPTVVPELPQWAWPRNDRVSGAPELKVVPISTTSPALLDMGTTRKIESFRGMLGDAIYAEILRNEGQCDSALGIRTRVRQLQVLRMMQTTAGLVRRVGALTRRLGTHQLMAEMEELNVLAVTEIPNLEVLAQLAQHLESIAARRVA